MDEQLYEAAINGSVPTLVDLLKQDPLILDRIIVSCAPQTPLHISSMRGHAEFVNELLTRTPQLASELDSDGNSALHLASARGHIEIIELLLAADLGTAMRRNGDGKTPLHVAASKGRVEAVSRLARARPESARVLTDRGETVLHLCARKNCVEVLKAVAAEESVREIVDDLVNKWDGDGNTALHIAVTKKHVEMIRLLLTIPGLEVNTPNSNGDTALDILQQSPRDLRDIDIETLLRNSHASLSKDLQSVPYSYNNPTQPRHATTTRSLLFSLSWLSDGEAATPTGKAGREQPKQTDWFGRKRSSLMVVASLISAVAFQATITPPGGVWQDDYRIDSNGNPVKYPHYAGTSIMSHVQSIMFGQFMIFNTLAFLSSLSIILLLVSGLPIKRGQWMWVLMVIMWVAITSQVITYLISLRSLSPHNTRGILKEVTDVSVVCWLCLMGLVFAWNVVRLNVWLLRKWASSAMKKMKKKTEVEGV